MRALFFYAMIMRMALPEVKYAIYPGTTPVYNERR
jgi:hypothetical protein